MEPTSIGVFGIGAAGLGVLAWLVRFLSHRMWLRDFLARAHAVAHDVVLETEQIYVDRVLAARQASSPGGAELTPQEQRDALDLAVNRLLDLLGLAAVNRGLRLLGLPQLPGFVRSWATNLVEARVKELSIAQVAAASGSHTAIIKFNDATTKPLPPLPLRPTRE